MGEDDKEYDIERELEDMKDLLTTEEVTCPNCSSKISPDLEKCNLCGYALKKEKPDDDFKNKLKATMWAPGMERGVPLGSDLPEPETELTFTDEDEDEDEEAPDDAEEELLKFLEEEEHVSDEEELVKEAFNAKERSKMTVSMSVLIFGVVFYILTAVYYEIGYSVMFLMVIGTILVLVGGNIFFDVILDRKKRVRLSSKSELGDAIPGLKSRLLTPGDRFPKTFWSLITIVGVLSYVLLPILSTDDILRFVGMGMGSILIVLGVSSAYIAFFHEHPVKEKEGEHVYEAFIESEEEKEEVEFEWACPVCNTPLSEDLDSCPECGAEFED
jgi:RNA polymerase subunit RPABC4/transcription elongation factor Spt4